MLVYVCVCLWWPSIYLGCIHGFPEILEFNKLQIEKSQKKKNSSLQMHRLFPCHLLKNTVWHLLTSIYMVVHCVGYYKLPRD